MVVCDNKMFMKKILTLAGLAAILPILISQSCSAPETDLVLTADMDAAPEGTVSERLLGFNIVYAKNPDSLWTSGVLTRAIKDVNPGFLRYPGGTVNTYFHWEHPTGNGWEDLWDPAYDTAKDRPASEYMDIDEYIALVKETGAEPLVGINVNSGFRWGRVEDGIQEALRLMKYCRDKGLDVKYWYMGNEPYMHDCNGGASTPAEYGEMINAFVPRMREFDPDIKIVANWHATFRKHGGQYDELFAVAGKNIDVVDVHWYCMWGNASWDQWLSRTPCGVFTGDSYESEIRQFREIATRNGYPDTELASLEWNVGPGKRTEGPRLTPDQSALIQSEMLIQFIRGGLDMATFWPLFWDSEFGFRSFFDKQTGKPQPISEIMKIFGRFQGMDVMDFSLEGAGEKIVAAAVRDKEKKEMHLCILNKNDCEVSVSLDIAGSKKRAQIENYHISSDLRDLLHDPSFRTRTGHVILKPYSLTFITL